MLMPKKTKYRKYHRGNLKGNAKRGTMISFGEYGIAAMERGIITARQIEAARVSISRHIKRGGKIWIKVFPDFPYTKKPAETRMGKGKGNPEYWVAKVRPGFFLFEVSGVSEELAKSALKLASSKLPLKTKFFTRQEIEGGIK